MGITNLELVTNLRRGLVRYNRVAGVKYLSLVIKRFYYS